MTKTEICNRALAALGHDRKITDFDGKTSGASGDVYNDTSTEAERCRQFFASALLNCLAEHDWDFAAVVRNLGNVTPDPFGWATFPMPPDAVRVCEVTDAEGHPFATRRDRDFLRVKTDGAPARIRYVTDDVDVEELPHNFNEAVVYQLAALLAGPMFGDDRKTEGFMNMASRRLSQAVTKETDETAYRGEWDNPFIRARR